MSFTPATARALRAAARAGDVRELRRLVLDDGVDVECASHEGYTALHAAAKRDRVISLRVLLCELGANADATSRDGFSAAHVAARYDASNALAALVEELGASPTLRSRTGDGPLHVAARYGSLRALKFLAGLRPGEPNNNGALPLHCAAARDQHKCVECLVTRFAASVNAQDASGATPLHWASYYGSVASIRCLGSNGADADVMRIDGARPLHIAAGAGHVSALQCLRVLGASLVALDGKGRFPVDVADQAGAAGAAAWLRQQPEVRAVLDVLGATRAPAARRRPPPTPPPARSPEAALKTVFDGQADIDATITVQLARRALEASALRLLGVNGEAFSRALERLNGADGARKLSWPQFRRVVASLAVLARADLALSPRSPATLASTFPDDDDTVESPPPPRSTPIFDVDAPPPPPPDATPPVPRRSVEEVATRLDAIASELSPSALSPSASTLSPSSLLSPSESALSPSSVWSPASMASPAPWPPSFREEETPSRRLHLREDDSPSLDGNARRETRQSSPPAWAETLATLRADPNSPIAKLVFDEAVDASSDGDAAAAAARERRELEKRDAATVAALELAVARAEALTVSRAEAVAALNEGEARAVARATRHLEADVERLTGERDTLAHVAHARDAQAAAAMAARATAEDRGREATPSKKDRDRLVDEEKDAALESATAELEGIKSDLKSSQAARSLALQELQRGIRRVRASRFWFADDPAAGVFRGVAAALGAAGCPAAEACRTFDEGETDVCVYCGHPSVSHARPASPSDRWTRVPPPSPIKSPASSAGL